MHNTTFYVTNDTSNGGTVRLSPAPHTVAAANESDDYSKMLTTPGTLEGLVLKHDSEHVEDEAGTFSWTLQAL